jgi:hypothetical protein
MIIEPPWRVVQRIYFEVTDAAGEHVCLTPNVLNAEEIIGAVNAYLALVLALRLALDALERGDHAAAEKLIREGLQRVD